jgi:hypothetical protein
MHRINSILAFGFSSPALLLGLVLAGIPLLIHLLHRRRYVEHRWAAMQFLVAAMKRESRRVRLQNLILLLLRTLVLAGLVFAFARPFLDADDGLLNSQQPVHRILVIDTSFSMQFEDAAASSIEADDQRAAGTRFARAKQILHDQLEAGRRGDAWNLVRIGGPEPLAVIGQASFRADAVDEEVEQLKVSDSRGDLLRTLTSVLELTEQAPELSRKEVTIVSDLQTTLWAPANDVTQKKLAELTKQIAANARLSVINVGSAASSNSAVVSLSSSDSPAISGQPVEVAAVLRNFGASPLREQIVELLIDGRIADTRRVDLSPGVDVPVEFSPTLRESGQHLVEVRLESDSLSVDNRRWLTVDVRDELRVLLVDGRSSGRARERASFYLERALAPSIASVSAHGSVSGSSIRPHVVTEGDLPSVAVDDYDAVVLCDVGLLTEREASLLDGYVRGGGGLVIFPGDRTQPDSFNTRLFRDGAGILPARIGEQISAPNGENVLTFDARGFAHPIVAAFRGNPDAGLQSTITVSYLKLEPDESASTALWFSDGSPALVERQAGEGRVVLAATGADDRWGTWAIWAPSFVPMMHETVRFTASGRWQPHEYLVGDPVTVRLDARTTANSVEVRMPDDSTLEVAVSIDDSNDSDAVKAILETTDRAGVYLVEPDSLLIGDQKPQAFAVNVDPAESDLTPIDHQRLTSDLYPDLRLQTVDAAADQSPELGSKSSPTVAALSRLLAWLVLLGLLVEPVLAWRFSTGVAAAAGLLVLTAGFQFGILHAALLSVVCASIGWLIRQRRSGATNQQGLTRR